MDKKGPTMSSNGLYRSVSSELTRFRRYSPHLTLSSPPPPSLDSSLPLRRSPLPSFTRFPPIPSPAPVAIVSRLSTTPPRSYTVVVLSVCCISYVTAYCLSLVCIAPEYIITSAVTLSLRMLTSTFSPSNKPSLLHKTYSTNCRNCMI